jgi:hypothetical protein
MFADPLAETCVIEQPLEWDDTTQPPNDEEMEGTPNK